MTDRDNSQQLEQLLHAINHDLRTPLSNIRSATAILLQNLSDPLTDDQRAFVEIIEQSTTRLLDQTNRLMLFSQIAFSSEAPEAIPLSEILGNAKRTLKNTYDLDSVTITTDGDPMLMVSVHTLSATLALLAVGDIKQWPETIPGELPAIHTYTLANKLCFTILSLTPAQERADRLVELSGEIVRQHDGVLEVGEAHSYKQFSFCVPLSSSPA
ncbi:MAG: HAMP domain-containing histidine kinase [Anaerolineaceae bacterium]|nr:HAMP domain-containing histidine kinase [Anaerolineaceae bacterium]